MPAAFGAWSWMGGHRYPFCRLAPFDNESQVQQYARKYKHGKRVGLRELAGKFKALEIVDFDSYVNGLGYCDYCVWEDLYWQKCEEEDDDEYDEYDEYMWAFEECKLPCRDSITRGNTRGVYTLNRQAFAFHDAYFRKGRSSARDAMRRRSPGQKRSAIKRDARDALREFKGRE